MPTQQNVLENLVLHPLPAPVPDLGDLPATAVRRVVADADFGFPCRRCLRDAAVGEQLVLLTYDPFLGDSPYRQPGPIYVHDGACEPDGLDVVPDQLLLRVLSVRAFDSAHLMVASEVVDGAQLAERATALLAVPEVAYLHVHNAGAGCFAVRIDRGRGLEDVGAVAG